MFPGLKPPLGSLINMGHPLTRGLVGAWLMNEGGGSELYDHSGNGLTPVLQSTASFSPGDNGQSLSFNGTSDYVDFGAIVIPTTGTISIRFKPNVNLGSSREPIWRSKVTGLKVFDIYPFNTGNLFAGWFQTGNDDRVIWSISGLNAGDWHIVTVTWANGGDTKLFIDADEKGSTSSLDATWDTAIADANNLARDVAGSEYFDGMIDFVYLWQRELRTEEVLDHYLRPWSIWEEDYLPLWVAATAGAVVGIGAINLLLLGVGP